MSISRHRAMGAHCDASDGYDVHVQPALPQHIEPGTAANVENQQLELHDSLSPASKRIALRHQDDNERADSDSDIRDEEHEDSDADEFAEEDAWLRACHFLTDEGGADDAVDDDPDRYVPKLMDTRAIRELRATLRKSEHQIETCGRMREFVPRKPTVSSEQRGTKRGASLRGLTSQVAGMHCIDNASADDGHTGHQRQQQGDVIWATGPTRAFLTAAPSATALDTAAPSASHRQREDFALVLRRELRQLRELELRYEETKRMLLEQMDIVCSLKPSERTGGPETYANLAELLVFAAQCEHPPLPPQSPPPPPPH